MSHTPGPWKIESTGKDSPGIVHAKILVPETGPKEQIAILSSSRNAQLIAAAPELLVACKTALEALYGDFELGDEAMTKCLDAIARVEEK